MKTILKLLTALAAIAGIVYVIATFGDKIVAWAKSILPTCDCDCDCDCDGECKCCCEEDFAEEAPAEDVAEEVVEEETVIEEAPVVDESEPVAEETDFEA